MPKNIVNLLRDGVVLGDGGYLIELERRGYVDSGSRREKVGTGKGSGQYTPEVAIEHPEALRELHREFLNAGSQVLQALTFYGTREKLKRAGYGAQTEAINKAAVHLAREVAGDKALVAASVSRTQLFEREGPSTGPYVRELFREQIRLLKEAGSDFLLLETFFRLDEMLIALECGRESGLPMVATLSLRPKTTETADGVSVGEAARRIVDAGAVAVGANCEQDPARMLSIIRAMRAAVSVPLAAQPAAFRTADDAPCFTRMPQFPDDLETLQVSRQAFYELGKVAQQEGIRYLGGCCGCNAAYHPANFPMGSTMPDGSDEVCALGLDVGGTKIAAGLVSSTGSVLEKRVAPTLPARGGEPVLRDALQLARGLAEAALAQRRRVVATGVAICELVDLQGRIVSNATVQWRGIPVHERFAPFAPCRVEADSRAAAFAEAHCGAGRPFDSFYYVTIGTGIGGSWVVNGRPFAGKTGCTGTLASSPTTLLCPDCGVIRHAILEEVASGSALVHRYNQRTGTRVAAAQDVLAAVAGGDAAAEWVLDTAIESLAATLGLLVNVLDPPALVIGGGLGSAPGPFWDRMAPRVRKYIWSEVHRDLPILQASCGTDSGMIGAALLAWESVGSVPEMAGRQAVALGSKEITPFRLPACREGSTLTR